MTIISAYQLKFNHICMVLLYINNHFFYLKHKYCCYD